MGPELLPLAVTRTLPTFTGPGKLAYNTAAALWHVIDDSDRRSWGLTGRLGTFVNDPATGGKLEG